MSTFNCCSLTCMQVSQEAAKVVWYFHLFKKFPQLVVIPTVKGFHVVKKQKWMFFWNSLAFSMIQQMLLIIKLEITLAPLPFLNPACTQFTNLSLQTKAVHTLLKPNLKDFDHNLTSTWNECNCIAVWAFFGIAFLWDWSEYCPLTVLWPLLSFPSLLAYWVQHFSSIIL